MLESEAVRVFKQKIKNQLDCSPKQSFEMYVYREYQAEALKSGIKYFKCSWSPGYCLYISSLRNEYLHRSTCCDEAGKRFSKWIEWMNKCSNRRMK